MIFPNIYKRKSRKPAQPARSVRQYVLFPKAQWKPGCFLFLIICIFAKIHVYCLIVFLNPVHARICAWQNLKPPGNTVTKAQSFQFSGKIFRNSIGKSSASFLKYSQHYLRFLQIRLKTQQPDNYYFPSKNFFRKENIQFSSQRYFSFSWNCPWRAEFKSAELMSCIIHVSGVTAVQIPDVAGSNPAIDHILCLSRHLTSSYNLTT